MWHEGVMAVASSQQDVQSRFAHLLQPIRDLATNWDIDLATELEDYLSEVKTYSFIHFPNLNVYCCCTCEIKGVRYKQIK